VLSDAGRSSVHDLLDAEALEKVCNWYEIQYGVDAFEARTAIYTEAAYALLRNGRYAGSARYDDGPILRHTRRVFVAERLRTLGYDYYHAGFDEDDWGNPYRIYPGPWPGSMGPVLFRAYTAPVSGPAVPGDSTPTADPLTVTVAGEDPGPRGFPAPRYKEFYIWSLGANGVCDQPRYDPTHQYEPPARQYYRSDAPDEYLGGGDDINNWDHDQTFMRYYN
jgi:hypothetical protein